MSGLIIFLPREPWATAAPFALLFPLLLWLAARCRPVFSTPQPRSSLPLRSFGRQHSASAFSAIPASRSLERILAAQAGILAVSLCSFVLAALFSERRQHEVALKRSEARTRRNCSFFTKPPRSGLRFSLPIAAICKSTGILTEICGISVADHIGRSVRDTVPQVADQVENIVQTILRTGESITGIEVNGQRPDGGNAERVWITNWHPLKAHRWRHPRRQRRGRGNYRA